MGGAAKKSHRTISLKNTLNNEFFEHYQKIGLWFFFRAHHTANEFRQNGIWTL
jgi:hypothetical protein